MISDRRRPGPAASRLRLGSAGAHVLFAVLAGLAAAPNSAAAAAYKGPGLLHSPPVLGAMDAGAYLRCREQIGRSTDTQSMSPACLEQAVRAYPFDGEAWHALGTERFEKGDWAGAIDALEHAYALGTGHLADQDAANLARASVRLERAREACRWIRIAIGKLHYRNPDSLLEEPEFRSVRRDPRCTGLPKPGKLVATPAGRAADLNLFLARVLALQPDLEPDKRHRLVRGVQALKRRSAKLSLDEFAVELQRLHAMVGRGHSGSPAMWDEKGLGSRGLEVLPVDFYAFPEGLFIIGEQGRDQSLVGAEVVAFGSTPATVALQRVASLIDRDPGSEMSVLWLGPRFLGMPAVLKALKLSASVKQAKLTVKLRDGRIRTVALDGGAFRPRPKLYAPSSAPATIVPLYLSRVSKPFWSAPLGPETLYVQFNQVRDSAAQTLSAFALQLRRDLDRGSIRNLVVDLRHNNGGDTYLYPELLRTLIGFDVEDGTRLFVITGRNTFSAAQNFVVDIDRLTDAIIVGEPASAPRAGGDEILFRLPNSGLEAGTAPVTWSLQSPADTRVWIAPELPVVLTARDYFANRDPVLETILKVIATGKSRD